MRSVRTGRKAPAAQPTASSALPPSCHRLCIDETDKRINLYAKSERHYHFFGVCHSAHLPNYQFWRRCNVTTSYLWLYSLRHGFEKRTSISQPKSRVKKCVANHLRQFRVKTPATVNPASTDRALFLASRLRTESHQTSVGIKLSAIFCGRPGGICRPRETLVPSPVQGVACTLRGYRVFDDASPLVAHDLGDSANCIH